MPNGVHEYDQQIRTFFERQGLSSDNCRQMSLADSKGLIMTDIVIKLQGFNC